MGCCSRSGSWGVVVVGMAGVVCGLLVGGALDLDTRSEAEGVLAPASFVQPEDEMSPEDMMAAMKELCEPVEEHELLKRMEGKWDCVAKFYMGGPDAPPTESKGSSDNRLVMGGRYVVQNFKMDEFMGEPFEGMGIVGFDRAEGKYVNDWIDTWSTGIMSMTGEYDEATETMDWRGTYVMPSPDGGKQEMPAHHVIKYVGDDKIVMEFWETNPENGEEYKGGEITYTRRG
ncbi:MAG TPA: DUF1579 domain-containing protein [Phycisphaerales bacterium]|nr:DUF1579 domain-containing protein [Phycisphaerales bacterium]